MVAAEIKGRPGVDGRCGRRGGADGAVQWGGWGGGGWGLKRRQSGRAPSPNGGSFISVREQSSSPAKRQPGNASEAEARTKK